jgi:hypothetical protein
MTKQREKRHQQWKYFAISFCLLAVVSFLVIYIMAERPLLDFFLVINILLPMHLVPTRLSFSDLPPSSTKTQMIFWAQKWSLKESWKHTLIFIFLLSMIIIFGPEEWIKPRPVIIIIGFYFWAKLFYAIFRRRKTR